MESLHLSTFQSLANDTFAVSLYSGDSLHLVLDSATVAGEQRDDGRPFSVVFRGPAENRLQQATYRMEHPKTGEFDIFLVPIGFAPNGDILYEAVFN